MSTDAVKATTTVSYGYTGLFVTLAFWDKDITENVIYQKLLSDKLSANLGYVYENIVAQMLTATGNKLFYHTWPSETSNHNYEVDFLLSRGAKLWPLEVKSSGYKTHKSLDEFCKKFSERISNRYLVYTKDYKKDGGNDVVSSIHDNVLINKQKIYLHMEQKFSNNSLDLKTLREFCKLEDAEADSYLSRPLIRERRVRREAGLTSRIWAMVSSS